MSSNDEYHCQSLDSRDTLQAQSVVLLRRNDLLRIVDDGEANDQSGDEGILFFAVVNGKGLVESAEE